MSKITIDNNKLSVKISSKISIYDSLFDKYNFFKNNFYNEIEKNVRITKIIDSNLYDAEILTHINSKEEGFEKNVFLKKHFPDIQVIPTPKSVNKCDMVNPFNCVLVDDFLGNLELWNAAGGISVKFSDSGKKGEFITITSLADLLIPGIYFQIKSQIKCSKIKEKRK